jgi:hypothetical protein
MSLTLRTDFGCTEAIIDDDCGLKRFYEVANILSDDLESGLHTKPMILTRLPGFLPTKAMYLPCTIISILVYPYTRINSGSTP